MRKSNYLLFILSICFSILACNTLAQSTATFDSTITASPLPPTNTSVPAPIAPPIGTPTATMPAYFKSNPALMPLRDWETTYGEVSPTSTHAAKPGLPTNVVQRPEFVDGIERYRWSPDMQKLLVIAKAQTPSAALTLGSIDGLPTEYPFAHEQAWIVDPESEHLKPVYYTDVSIDVEWATNNSLILYSPCYGPGAGIEGVNVLNLESGTFRNLLPDYYGNCEGGLPFLVSPDGQHLVYLTDVINIETGSKTTVCLPDEFSRSYTWSHDSRYLYVACTTSKETSDQLYRYNTETQQTVTLTQRGQITFKAIKLWLSPDEQQIFFEWGNSHYVDNTEKYGTWVLDLTQLEK